MIQNADIIAVFQDGKVIEKDSHNQLMAKQVVYHACKYLSLYVAACSRMQLC